MSDAKQLPAFYNRGQWVVSCPTCKWPILVDLITNTAVCTYCYPSLRADALQPIQGGLFRPVPDFELREQTRKEAEANGHYYAVEFPEERQQIEAVLRERPLQQNMNWFPEKHYANAILGLQKAQTVEDLIVENEAHGIDMSAFVLPDAKADEEKKG